jgi:tRNA pseudouridine synthase 10
MVEPWRQTRLDEALARADIRKRVQAALKIGSLCDHCLGRLLAGVDTGLGNDERGRRIRAVLAAPPAHEPCGVCDGLFADIDTWAARAARALCGWELETFAVASHVDPALVRREETLWQQVGGDLAEPYKQAFNRLLGTRLCDDLPLEPDLKNPDVLLVADHAAAAVTLRVAPLWISGRYRKLVRGIPQCRWRAWPTSVQQVIGDPVCRAAGAGGHLLHGCGREDVDVRCLGERPFILEVLQPHRRRLDWADLARTINQSGQVEVLDLAPCARSEVARLKSLRPDKTYRALVRLAAEIAPSCLERLMSLVGPIRQRTPRRVRQRRSNLVRHRHVRAMDWRRLDGQTMEMTVRTDAGLYVKELISGDDGRTCPSVAEVLGVPAECAELDVLAIHLDAAPRT